MARSVSALLAVVGLALPAARAADMPHVVLSIVALGLISIVNSRELAGGSLLARSFCLYAAAFWGAVASLSPFMLCHHVLLSLYIAAPGCIAPAL